MTIRIIGGGVIGFSVAYHLSRTTKDIFVYEIDESYTKASFSRSCGGLRCQFSQASNVLMSLYSIDFIRRTTDVPIVPNGYLMLFDESRRADHDASLAIQCNLGAKTKSFSADALKTLIPELFVDDLYRGCLTDDGSEGWVDPVRLHHWFKDEAISNGVSIRFKDFHHERFGASDTIIVCAGCWSRSIASEFGVDLPIIGDKHTVYNFKTTRPQKGDLPLVADLTTGVYVRPEGDGYIVGYSGNSEGETENLEPNWALWEEVWGLLYYRFPNLFDEVKLMGAWAGFYDACQLDQNAIIDQKKGIYFATGFTGRGLMHSPAVGLAVSELVLNLPMTFDLRDYQLDRAPTVEKYVI